MPELYEKAGPGPRQKQDAWARQMAGSWDWAEVVWSGVCLTRQASEEAVARFEAEKCDIVVVVLLTYAPSLNTARALVETRLPVVLLDTQPDDGPGRAGFPGSREEMPDEFLMLNHGVHGVQDLANVLLRMGRSVPIVVGPWKDAGTVAALKEWCLAAAGRSILRRMRVGLVGRAMAGMGDFAVDEAALAVKIGPQVVPVEPRRIAELAAAADARKVEGLIAENQKKYEIAPELTAGQHEAGVRVALALEQIAQEDALEAMAVHFLTVSEDGRVPTLPFYGASRLLELGYGYAGEGDVCCASLTAALQKIVGVATFTEIFSIDFPDNSLIMAHMGECNPAMARKDRKPVLAPRPFPLAATPEHPATTAFALEPGEVTLASLSIAPGGTFKVIIAPGSVTNWGPAPGLIMPNFKFSPRVGVPVFLRRWSEAGGSHHQSLVYGKRVELLANMGSAMGLDVVVIE
ncbi:MAG: hypothetical protein IT442_02265 [Phycisphaeraceae bacterium]|nr:hypothetical protein [Phycisphaeraceae bacterium]